MNKKVLYGTIILTGAGFIAKVLGAIYRVPLINLIGTNGIGLFQLVFPMYALFLVLSCSGVPVALSKLVSVELEKNNCLNVKKLFKISLLFMFLLGVIFAILLCIFAKVFANIQGCSDAFMCYFALAPSIIIVCCISVFKGYFQGFQNMVPSAIVQILEQLFKLIFALLLAKFFVKYGMIYGVLGTMLGITISELLSLAYCFIAYKINNKKIVNKTNEDSIFSAKHCVKLLVKNSLPIMINGTIIPLTCAIESLTIVWLLSKAGIGSEVALRIYGLEDGVVGSLINMPTVVAVAISTAIVPNLAVSFSNKNIDEINNKCKMALKYVWLVALPCSVIYLVMADKIIYFLYSTGLNSSSIDQFLIATNLLRFSSINIIYISILNTITAVLQACNKSFIPVKNLLIASIIKIAMNFVLITSPVFNIYGLVLTDIICFSLACVLNLRELKKYVSLKLNFKKIFFVPTLATIGMYVFVTIFQNVFAGFYSGKLLTLITIIFAFIFYVAVLFICKVFTREELSALPKFAFKRKNSASKADF